MEWLVVAGVVAVVIFYCRRQRPWWPFALAAAIGGAPGAACGLQVLGTFVTPDEMATLPGTIVLVAAVGAAGGACAAMAIVGCCMGSRAQAVGGLLGALAGIAVSPMSMLLVPQWCFERLEDCAFVAIASALTLIGVFAGARLATRDPGLPHKRQTRAAAGVAVILIAAGGAHMALRQDTVRAHGNSLRRLMEVHARMATACGGSWKSMTSTVCGTRRAPWAAGVSAPAPAMRM